MSDLAQGAASLEEARLFQAIANKWTPLSDDIKRVEFRYGESSDGSPAVWIIVVMDHDLNPSDNKIRSIRTATEKFREDIMALDTDRWPYITIKEE